MEVDTKATGKRASVTVLASLDESASLCGMDGQQADGYRSSYDAQYQMTQVRAYHGCGCIWARGWVWAMPSSKSPEYVLCDAQCL
jgi:hypothetical protein